MRNVHKYVTHPRNAGLVEYWRTHGWPSVCHPTTGDDFECSKRSRQATKTRAGGLKRHREPRMGCGFADAEQYPADSLRQGDETTWISAHAMGGRLGCDLSDSSGGSERLGPSRKDSRKSRCDAQPGEDPDCAHRPRLGVSWIQNPTWERTVQADPRPDQIHAEPTESLCHSPSEVSGPIQRSDQNLDQEAHASANG
jgi:hypothetical protein